jgi:RHS repeat-associated protein
MTDSGGNKIGEQGHYPFGESWYAQSTTTKWQYTTYERDAESGNDYAMARYDVNRLGRFSALDPVAGYPVNPQSLNRYGYVLNSPVTNIDPYGTTCTRDKDGNFSGDTCDQDTGTGDTPHTIYVDGGSDSEPSDDGWTDADPMFLNMGQSITVLKRFVTPPRRTLRGIGGLLGRIAAVVCSAVPDVTSQGVGGDLGLGVAASGQFTMSANGSSGELTASVSLGFSGGVVSPDVYFASGATWNAPDNSGLDSHGQPSLSYAGGVYRAGVSGGDGSYQVTYGPSVLPVTLAVQLSASKPLFTIPYAGYAYNLKRAACKLATGK